jgi:histidinol-phosphate/aromatic aminotransferase/cobyric acid decarboxylase-like protein
LTTLYLVDAKNIDSWHVRKWDLQRAFPLDVPMVRSPKLFFIANYNNPTGVGLTPDNTIHFGSL